VWGDADFLDIANEMVFFFKIFCFIFYIFSFSAS